MLFTDERLVPTIGTWYVVYSRAWYTDLRKDINGFTCRDLSGPQATIGLPSGISLSGIVELNQFGEIIVDKNMATNIPGVYAAGDSIVKKYRY